MCMRAARRFSFVVLLYAARKLSNYTVFILHRFYITWRVYGINRLMNGIYQLIHGMNRLISGITPLINGLTRLIDALWGQGRGPGALARPLAIN